MDQRKDDDMFTVAVKSGTNGHFEYDDNDLVLAEIQSDNIPHVGDILEFGDAENKYPKKYLVREIKRFYNRKNEKHPFGEYIYVYVISV